MERLRNMGLKRSLFLLSVLCLAAALLLTFGISFACEKIEERYPQGGIAIGYDGVVTRLEEPAPEQEKILRLLGRIRIFSMLVVPVSGLGLAGILFYRLKLKKPIALLQGGMERIQKHDLDFVLPEVSGDELGQICAAFETMRAELLRTNQELWRQAEERKRLNAAFAHDLRNPVTVLKGTVKQLGKNRGMERSDEEKQALERLETYTLRIEQYVEAMSGIQRLEQMPVCRKTVDIPLLREELEETARLLAPSCRISLCVKGGSGAEGSAEAGFAGAGADSDSVLEDALVLDGLSKHIAVSDSYAEDAAVSDSHVEDTAVSDSYVEDTAVSGSLSGDAVVSDSFAENAAAIGLDHGLFLTVVENLLGNAARFAREELVVLLAKEGDMLVLTVKDDGPGYPAALLQGGPKPFIKIKDDQASVGKRNGDSAHFGMGLYSCQLLCGKHGGALRLKNGTEGGAEAEASFRVH